jgi:hypothetical protein
MNEAAVLGIKALNGGTFVVGFALVGEMLAPKRFAGLFSAAPSVALANLIVVVAAKGHLDAVANTRGMVVGAFAFGLSCLVGAGLVRRLRAVRASLVIMGMWLALAVPGYLVFLR